MPKETKWEGFLETLSLHNKDLDVCFYDVLAEAHLIDLFKKDKQQTLDQQKKNLIEKAIECCGKEMKYPDHECPSLKEGNFMCGWNEQEGWNKKRQQTIDKLKKLI